MNYKKLIAQNIKLDGFDTSEIENSITFSADLKMGDFSLPCFKFSKVLRKSPVAVADGLAAEFPRFDWLASVASVSGYLNFFVNREVFAANAIAKVFSGGENEMMTEKIGVGKTIVIDYSSVNIAKPFHIGHLLTTAIGGSLYRIYQFLGYNVVGVNHLGDWGTQFGKLITAYLKWGSDEDIEQRGIKALLEYYVRFHAEEEIDKTLSDEGRAWFRKIETGDEFALSIFHKFKEVTLAEVNKTYVRLGIHFDSYNGESFYNDKIEPVVQELRDKNLLSESNGASVVDLDAYKMPPCLILKSDGASLYATRDLAAALYRKATYNFDKCLYVVAYQQNLHFSQVFKTLDLMGYEWSKDCVHVPFGMVSLEDGTLSTRKGNVVFLSDVLDQAVEKTLQIINEKNPNIANKEKISEDVGIGAVIFGALSSGKIKDMVFSYDKALNFDGETAPYIQYTHARCCSIIAKAEASIPTIAAATDKSSANSCDYSLLTDDVSFALVKLIDSFDGVVIAASTSYEPSYITRLLIDIAQAFNKFYFEHRILGESEEVSRVRILLTKAVQKTLKIGLNLILINAPTQM